MSGTIKNIYDHPPEGGKAPKQIIILLHGLGSNGQDLISLAPFWAPKVPDAVFVSPDAPFPCDMAPMGYQWFSLQDRNPSKMLAGVKIAAPILNAFIDNQLSKYNLTYDKLALVGFSQGTMMSLYAAPRMNKKIAGVLGYSGALIGAEDLDGQEIQKPPIHLIHGIADMVVPIQAHIMAEEALKANGFDVSGHTTQHLGHSIDEKGINSGAEFLKEIF